MTTFSASSQLRPRYGFGNQRKTVDLSKPSYGQGKGRPVSRRANSGGSVALSSRNQTYSNPISNSVAQRWNRSASTDRDTKPRNLANTFADSLSGYRSNRYPLVKGGSASERSSRASSLLSVASNLSSSTDWSPEVDYKVLYENEKSENEKLAERIKRLEEIVNQTITNNDHDEQNGTRVNDENVNLTKPENERENLERRISELEKITQTVEQLRLDNARLKEENGALIRVISKLSR